MTKGLVALVILSLIGLFSPKQSIKTYLCYFIGFGLACIFIDIYLWANAEIEPIDLLLLRSSWSYGNLIVAVDYLVIFVGLVGISRNLLERKNKYPDQGK